MVTIDKSKPDIPFSGLPLEKLALASASVLSYLLAGAALLDRYFSSAPAPCPPVAQTSQAIEPVTAMPLLLSMTAHQTPIPPYAGISIFLLIGITLLGSIAIVFASKNDKAVAFATDALKMILGFCLGVAGTIIGVK